MRDKNKDFITICDYLAKSENHKHYTLKDLKKIYFTTDGIKSV